MNTHNKTVQLKIFGHSYDIKCPQDEANNLTQAAAHLNKTLQAINNKQAKKDESQLFMMAALTISHELVTEQNKNASLNQAAAKMSTQIDNALK